MPRLVTIASFATLMTLSTAGVADARSLLSKAERAETKIRLANLLNGELGLQYSRREVTAKDIRLRVSRPTSPWSEASIRFSVRKQALRGTGSISAILGGRPVIHQIYGVGAK